ncbi:MAG TPA: PAS domain-containing sensor histidine kinase [Candidatus Thermoplasmatota archaeon]|nr:PAS domain-containing sensor histidine kinase [Candidatus Thermoplasmatota archaeon]
MPADLDRPALLHKLLERQLKRHFGIAGPPPSLGEFLASVNASYVEADSDRRLVERSLELTSQELLQRNADLREREREQQIIFDSVPAMIFYKDAENRILRLNVAAAQAMGKPREALQGVAVEDLFPPEVAKALHDDDLQVIRSGQPRLGIIESHPSGDGKAHWFRTDKVPFRDDKGNVKGVIVLSVDITDRREAEEAVRASEEQLKVAYDRLKQVDKERMQFINNAAHELGTPLTPIKLQIHLLKTSLADAPQLAKPVGILDRNFDRLSRLVRDLLDSARLQAAMLKLHPQPMDLRESVYQAVENYLASAREARIVMDVEDLPHLPVVADPTRLGQVFDNLLSNAVKFTPTGKHIRVAARTMEGMAVVTVQDEGLGIRPEDVKRLFQPFTQVHDTMQVTRGGTGLGLYVCRGIMEALGGSVQAESSGLGSGSTFTVRIPLASRTVQ